MRFPIPLSKQYMTKQFFTPRKSDQPHRKLQARDQLSGEMPETLCDVVNRICDRYLFREGQGWPTVPTWGQSSGRPT